jgi:imidazolonepropionase-like amidohydrolase
MLTQRLLKYLLVIPVTLWMATGLPASSDAQAQPTPIVVQGGWMFNGEGMVPNPGLRVRAGKIMQVGNVQPPASDRVIELAEDEYLLPGFIDMHAHYAMDLFGEGRVEEHEVYPLLFLANGVTSTFTAGEMQPEEMLALRRAIERGERRGPRIFNTGPYYGTARPGWDTTKTVEELQAEIDHWAAQGVRGIKVKRLGPRLLPALIERAHQHGLTVTGHLGSGYGNTVNPRDAITMGIDRIEHFLGGDALPDSVSAYDSLVDAEPGTPAFRRITQHFIDHQVYFDATITAYGYYGAQEPAVFEDFAGAAQYFTPHMQEVIAARRPRDPFDRFETIYQLKHRRIKAFYDAGAGPLITLGTDHPSWGQFLAPFSVHRELHAFVRAGIPPGAALRFATINGARALGVSDRLGSIETGKWADLMVVRGNPLADIRNTRNVQWTMKAGAIYDAQALKDAAKGRIGPAGPDEEAAWKPRASQSE